MEKPWLLETFFVKIFFFEFKTALCTILQVFLCHSSEGTDIWLKSNMTKETCHIELILHNSAEILTYKCAMCMT